MHNLRDIVIEDFCMSLYGIVSNTILLQHIRNIEVYFALRMAVNSY